jgi:hypothetical protein
MSVINYKLALVLPEGKTFMIFDFFFLRRFEDTDILKSLANFYLFGLVVG